MHHRTYTACSKQSNIPIKKCTLVTQVAIRNIFQVQIILCINWIEQRYYNFHSYIYAIEEIQWVQTKMQFNFHKRGNTIQRIIRLQTHRNGGHNLKENWKHSHLHCNFVRMSITFLWILLFLQFLQMKMFRQQRERKIMCLFHECAASCNLMQCFFGFYSVDNAITWLLFIQA